MAIKKVFFMSATILDLVGFAKNFGLSKQDTALIKVQSDFPPENSPIIYKPCGSMNYKEIDNTLPKIIEEIKNILLLHKEEKGIIHTANHKLAKEIFENVKDDRLIIHINAK
jgi:Rad3-related DNA helicase